MLIISLFVYNSFNCACCFMADTSEIKCLSHQEVKQTLGTNIKKDEAYLLDLDLPKSASWQEMEITLWISQYLFIYLVGYLKKRNRWLSVPNKKSQTKDGLSESLHFSIRNTHLQIESTQHIFTYWHTRIASWIISCYLDNVTNRNKLR